MSQIWQPLSPYKVVARDGIEPPTPAFSGPRSTTELSGLSANFRSCYGRRGFRRGRRPVGRPTGTALKTTSDSIATPGRDAKPVNGLQRCRTAWRVVKIRWIKLRPLMNRGVLAGAKGDSCAETAWPDSKHRLNGD